MESNFREYINIGNGTFCKQMQKQISTTAQPHQYQLFQNFTFIQSSFRYCSFMLPRSIRLPSRGRFGAMIHGEVRLNSRDLSAQNCCRGYMGPYRCHA